MSFCLVCDLCSFIVKVCFLGENDGFDFVGFCFSLCFLFWNLVLLVFFFSDPRSSYACIF